MIDIFDKELVVNPHRLVGREEIVPVRDMAPFVALAEVDAGIPLEQTAYYAMFKDRGSSNADARRDVTAFLKKREDIQKRREIGNVSIRIDDQGRLVLAQGYESAAIAASLEMEKIKVDVASRSDKWIDLVNRLYDVRHQRYSYMPILQPEEHPEFATWKFSRGPARAKIIAEDAGDLTGQRWLDVGSLTGYHTRMLDVAGAEAFGIEMHQPYAEIAAMLNTIQGTDAAFYNQELRAWLQDNQQQRFDGIVCLSIIHNIAQSGDPEGAKRAFRALSEMAPKMYFDIGQAQEGTQVTRTGLDLREENLAVFVRENSRYRCIEPIGRDNDYHGRVLFKLSLEE